MYSAHATDAETCSSVVGAWEGEERCVPLRRLSRSKDTTYKLRTRRPVAVRQPSLAGQGWLKNSLIGGLILTVAYLLVPAPADATMTRHHRGMETVVPASRLLAPQAEGDRSTDPHLTHEILNTGLLSHRFRKAQESHRARGL